MKLQLEDNDLRAPFPMDALANCKKLTELSIANIPINGFIPDSIGKLSRNLRILEAFQKLLEIYKGSTLFKLKYAVWINSNQNEMATYLWYTNVVRMNFVWNKMKFECLGQVTRASFSDIPYT